MKEPQTEDDSCTGPDWPFGWPLWCLSTPPTTLTQFNPDLHWSTLYIHEISWALNYFKLCKQHLLQNIQKAPEPAKWTEHKPNDCRYSVFLLKEGQQEKEEMIPQHTDTQTFHWSKPPEKLDRNWISLQIFLRGVLLIIVSLFFEQQVLLGKTHRAFQRPFVLTLANSMKTSTTNHKLILQWSIAFAAEAWSPLVWFSVCTRINEPHVVALSDTFPHCDELSIPYTANIRASDVYWCIKGNSLFTHIFTLKTTVF